MAQTYQDTNVNQLVINKLTKQEYNNLPQVSDNELYLVEESLDSVVTQNSTNPVTSGAVYNALQDIQPKTLDTSLTIDGTTVTTVEDALDALNNRPSSSGGVTSVDYDTQNKKLTQTVSGSTTDIVTVGTLKNDMNLSTVSTTTQNNVTSTVIQGDTYVNSGSLNAVGGDITCIPSQGASQITMTGLNASLGTKVTNGGGVSNIKALTKSAYNQLTPDANTMYVITDNVSSVGIRMYVVPAQILDNGLEDALNANDMNINDIAIVSNFGSSDVTINYTLNGVVKTSTITPDADKMFRYLGDDEFKPIIS